MKHSRCVLIVQLINLLSRRRRVPGEVDFRLQRHD